jgi:uncharacterized protein YndB with AHSA1/START domain
MSELYKTSNYLSPMLVVEYEINADQKSVYHAWTNLEVFKKWFLPTGFSIAKAEMNAQAGGHFFVHMQSPEGEIYPTKGDYILLEAPRRIVYKDSWDDDRENNEPIVAEIIFEPKGTNTLIKIYSSFATEEQKENTLKSGIADGWLMFFDNLNGVLKG